MVFEKGTGKLKEIKARIELEENATPIFHRARPVPCVLLPKVEAEVQNLVDSEVLSRVVVRYILY